MKKTSSYAISAALCILGALVLSDAARAYTFPEPKSGGKFFRAKGTKAGEDYRNMAGSRPFTDYGKGLEVGIVDLKPFAEYNLTYDDNIFLDNANEQDDLIHRVRAGTTAEVPFAAERHVLYGTYIADVEWFDDFADEDHDDHIGQAGVALNFVPFTLNVEDTYKLSNAREQTELTDRVERDENTFDALLNVPFARFFVEAEVVDYYVNFDEGGFDAFDRNELAVYPRVGFDIGPSTQILGEYGYTDISYENADQRDGEANEGSVGLRGHLTERMIYQIWGGYQERTYEGGNRSDYSDPIARGELRWDISETSTLTVHGRRRPQESLTELNYYVNNQIGVHWRQQIAQQWFFNTREYLDYNEYQEETVVAGVPVEREDYAWLAGAGIEYVMPNNRVSFLVEYKFRQRESNIDTFDYDANAVTLGVRGTF